MQKTTIIISDLSKPELLKVAVTIKQYLVEYQKQHGLSESQLVENWSELPTLSRLVIILTEESYATEIYSHLTTALPNYKVHLSESLIRRSKSEDSLQAPANEDPLDSKLYREPKPTNKNEIKLEENQPPRTLFKPSLSLNTNTDSPDLQDPARERSPRSPTITLEECTSSPTRI